MEAEDNAGAPRALATQAAPKMRGKAIAALANNPARAVALAMEQGNLELVEKFMALQREWEADQARKAFNIAFANFKAEAVTIIRAKEITDGPLKGRKYAELYSVIDAVTPALSRHELSTAWRISRDEKDWIEVTCVLRHSAGHSDTVSMGGAPDVGPGRNAIQARQSTVTYLERNTLKAILGVSDRNDDTDGAAPKGEPEPTLTQEEAANIEALLTEVGASRRAFLGWAKVDSIAQIYRKHYKTVVREIEARRQRSQ